MSTSLGICLGASTVKVVALSWKSGTANIDESLVQTHGGNPEEMLSEMLKKLNTAEFDYICVTGRSGKEFVNQSTITEPEATEYTLQYWLNGNKSAYGAIVSLGSENFVIYELDRAGNIVSAKTGSKCASGTGEFFLQQIRRMNISVEEAVRFAHESEPHHVSGRCSVFCKSDCTHALNKGVPIGNVTAGLGSMVAEKILELLQSLADRPILVVGGVTKNSYIMERLRQRIPEVVIPSEADYFEAFGAAICAYEKRIEFKKQVKFESGRTNFTRLAPLSQAMDLVEFKDFSYESARENDECIIGLDVGSTTTKAVLLRVSDNAVVASIYLRTNGKPVAASRECYRELNRQLNGTHVNITGLGVTGSGRQITGLHALTDGIITEILAHATAATYFDPEVDTILEIGGQDAKYTYLVNGVPCDYAMNEACSAGTGSFLEEAAKEAFGIDYRDIEKIALTGKQPPNFNDQCAAFINSDIKNALQENVGSADIMAGLVYSICINYNNRVKGQRRIGNHIFMQGGVCYNKAVPLAMANILDRSITVPPEPGLMGAFGVALEIKNRIAQNLREKSTFDLNVLANREVEYGRTFVCKGCDRQCEINVIHIEGKKYTFGGACNRYYNLVHHLTIDAESFDLVAKRQHLVFDEYYRKATQHYKTKETSCKTVGIPKSLLVNTYFPLYYRFFEGLGLRVILSDGVDPEGSRRISSAFCYPLEVGHGVMQNLLDKDPDVIFLPHLTQLYLSWNGKGDTGDPNVCVTAEGEPYVYRSVFREYRDRFISPILDFSQGWGSMENKFIEIAKELGKDEKIAQISYRQGVQKLEELFEDTKLLGDKLLMELEADPEKTAVILFGRSYNAFADEANLGIPRKFASRGFQILPFDSLRYDEEECIENLGWAACQEIIKAAHVVKRHPQLFGVFITNFGCGPDSIILTYFRDIMGSKPSLTLELDSHSADAGVNTRVEAFMDIVERYRTLHTPGVSPDNGYRSAKVVKNGNQYNYITSEGESVHWKDPRVKLFLPSMGRFTTGLGGAALTGCGFNCEPSEPPDFSTLMLGRKHTLCKECLPLILVTGSLLDRVKKRKDPNELLLYFMPATIGSCRFCQYYIFLQRLVEKLQIPNVAMLTFSGASSFSGFGGRTIVTLLKAVLVADVMDEIHNTLCVLAVDKEQALHVFNKQIQTIAQCFKEQPKRLYSVLKDVSLELSLIELTRPLSEARKVLVCGEMTVRKDEFSSEGVVNRLMERGIVVKRAPLIEYIHYMDYLSSTERTYKSKIRLGERFELLVRNLFKRRIEKKIKRTFARSGLYKYEMVDIKDIMKKGSVFIPESFTGEMILAIGSFYREIVKHVHGVVSIGPFACLPTRIIESILSLECRLEDNDRLEEMQGIEHLKRYTTLPFLSVESDGNPLPQIMQTRLESFCLQVDRLHEQVNSEIVLPSLD
ncbi:MAG: acyl-CoA dehydratase activase [Planctomycetes bacterium]|nr:acyl-CoA dehydratase activase [Planctomycetota bacterium]